MPNWNQNVIAFKGSDEQVLSMLNDGLKNSEANECDSLADAVDSLVQNAKHKVLKDDKVELGEGLTLRTFLPIPDTFLLYDTTNYAKKYPEIAAEQYAKYGVFGWYDYNCLTIGTKWDAAVDIDDCFSEDGKATIFFYCDTANNYPDAWIHEMERKYGLKGYILTKEEGGFYYFYGTSEEQIDLLAKEEELYNEFATNCEDGDVDLDREAYFEAVEELWLDSRGKFYDYVSEH